MKSLSKLGITLVFGLLAGSAFAGINPNQIQDYHNVFTGRSVNVNGGSEVSQINGTTLITPTTASYPIDNVMLTTTTAGVFQSVQVNSTNVGTYTTGYIGSLGATNALRWSVLATHGAPASTDEFASYYPIEGLNFSRFQYGTANAKAGSLQFKVRCSVSGTYSGAIKNYANTRSYPFSYSCTLNTDTQVYVQNIPGDTGGTWVGNTNAGAAYITFDLGSGTNFKSTAATWQTGDYNGVTGTTNLSAQANGATLTITDVQFEVGTFSTAFERKLYPQVLADCKRYLPYFAAGGVVYAEFATGMTSASTTAYISLALDVPTRVPVTGAVYSNIAHIVFADGAAIGRAVTALTLNASNGGTERVINLGLTSSGATVGAAIAYFLDAAAYIYFTGARI